MTVHDTEEQRVQRLLTPLQDIPPVPYRERRAPARRRWVRPVLLAGAGLVVVVAVGAAIVTAESGGGSQPAGTTPAPPITETSPTVTTAPTAPAAAAWFVQDGKLTRTGPPATGTAAARDAVEALLAGPPEGFATTIPAGTRLEEFRVADTIGTIRLSGPALTGTALEQLARTVTDAGVRWIRLGDEPGLVDPAIASGGQDTAPAIELVRADFDGRKIRFAGTADTFEANVQLRLMAGDRQLAESFVTATCGTGCRGSFEGALDVPAGVVPDADTGAPMADGVPVRLEAFTTSAEDGSERDLVRLAISPR
jgi:hypothetical protein